MNNTKKKQSDFQRQHKRKEKNRLGNEKLKNKFKGDKEISLKSWHNFNVNFCLCIMNKDSLSFNDKVSTYKNLVGLNENR